MAGVDDKVFVALGLAALTWLSYFAVKHPKVYRDNLCEKIYVGSFVIIFAMGGWAMAVSHTFDILSPFIVEAKREAARQTLPLIPGNFEWWALGILVYFGYLLFLSWLAGHILREELEKQKELRRQHKRIAGTDSPSKK